MTLTVAALLVASSVGLQAPGAKFDPAEPLQPAALEFFLTRLAEKSKLTGPAAEAAAALRAGQFDAALASLNGAKTDQLGTAFLSGLALYGKGELEKAAVQFRQAIRLDSEFFPAMVYLGACYAAGGRDDQAIGAWQTSLVTETAAPFVYGFAADAMLRLKRPDEAAALLEEAGAQWPDDEGLQARRAAALGQAGKGEEGLRLLDALMEKGAPTPDRLMVAMRILYEVKLGGRSLSPTIEGDRVRFRRYAEAYAAAGGPDTATVERWRLIIER
jgi:tetratricopeptide (TPR) repeat protein